MQETIRRLAAFEDKDFFSPTALSGMRRHKGMSQVGLAIIIGRRTGFKLTQNEISRMETSGVASRILKMEATIFFRSLGYDADKFNDMIYVGASTPEFKQIEES